MDYFPFLIILLLIPMYVFIIWALISKNKLEKKILLNADDEIANYPKLARDIPLVKSYMENKKVRLAAMAFSNSFVFKFAADKTMSEYEGFIKCDSFNDSSNQIVLSQEINMKTAFNKAKNIITLDDLKTQKIETREEMHALIGAIVIFAKCHLQNVKWISAVNIEDVSSGRDLEFKITLYK